MANILISSIGVGNKNNGNYQTAVYEYNGKKIETSFVSKVLVEFCNDPYLFAHLCY